MRRLYAIAAAATALLAGCSLSLFPKTQPSQLYAFHVNTGAPAADAARSFNVERLPTDFASQAQGDRILTIDGDQAAYIAGARWAAPAAQLFDQAESVAFESANGPARLLRTGDAGSATVSLRLNVQAFEARYLAGPKAAPTIVVSVHALLVAGGSRKVIADQVFESQRAAADNRVSAIVSAFDDAATDVLGRIVDWTAREGATVSAG